MRVLALSLLGLAALPGVFGDAARAAETPEAQKLAHGAYLVGIMGCGDCHTPLALGPEGPVPDLDRMLSGHPSTLDVGAAPALGDGPWVWAGAGTNTAFAGPWGVSFATNLTPDPDTGIGRWTEKMFVDTMRTGLHWGSGRQILPPMPWPAYATATDDDLSAIFAYLESLQPIANAVPAPRPPAPSVPTR